MARLSIQINPKMYEQNHHQKQKRNKKEQQDRSICAKLVEGLFQVEEVPGSIPGVVPTIICLY